MGWSSLSGPIVGRLLVTEQDAPDLSLTLETARAAGVHWAHDGALGNVDFCLAPTGSRPRQAMLRGHWVVFYADFISLLAQHQADGEPLRDLLLMHLFRHQEPYAVGSTYQFSLVRGDELQESLCSLYRTNLHQQTGAPFLEGARESDQETTEFPVSAVRGSMRHVGSGTRVFAKSVAAALPGGESLSRPSNTVTIGGDVGQQVNGDQTVTAPMTFNVGGTRRKDGA